MNDINDQTAEVTEADVAPETEAEVPAVDELTLLKERANAMGIKFHPSIGLEALKAKVNEAMTAAEPEKQVETVAAVQTAPEVAASIPFSATTNAPLDPGKAAQIAARKAARDDAMRLVRLRITNLNPAKKDLHGEILTVANEVVGIVKKFIPFGEVTESGYHVPNILYKQLKARKFLQVKVRKDPRRPGQDIVEQRWVPEFALEVLDPLTEEELAELARIQAASAGAGSE